MANEVETNEQVFNEENRPEPPKDENGRPMMPPQGGRGPMGGCCGRGPEPPKDENGNPKMPPEGGRPPMGGPCGERPEPPKDENGNPMMPPEGAPEEIPEGEQAPEAE